ncbi:SDR family NAD(P)-dependent oxidoreductase [Acuticoccus sediminis]|uniref:SDR family NAD(P)-dependent oxidoreductase n=1 Tax=Acuticoccus sediminis TaxID=2184697 RepID=UPI001CFCC0D1|nr:SDR family NAD(P)-dependent oxidoreductase [Acuticoccus sediminis]
MATALITGGHGGIGLECSRTLAGQYGMNLLLAGRSEARMASVAQELANDHGVQVQTLALDTSSLTSVRAAAAHCRALIAEGVVEGLDAIICNAGARIGALHQTCDGYEETFATNHLGHFLLVELLIDLLSPDGRVVFTASGTHNPETMDGRLVGKAAEPDADALARCGQDLYPAISAGVRYSTSKLCNILCAYEVHRRLKRSGSAIASIAFDPGSTARTGFLRDMPAPVRILSRTSFSHRLQKRMGITMGSVAFSGACLARLAADTAFSGMSGKYMQSNDGQLFEARSSRKSYDQAAALALWDASKRLAGLQPEEEAVLLR